MNIFSVKGRKDLVLGTELNPLKSAVGSAPSPRTSAIRSPWQPGNLAGKMVWSDIFGTKGNFITREDAMSIPAVAKARNLLVSLLAGQPLVQLSADSATPDADQPNWLQATDGVFSPWHRMAWTLDDCAFYGWSLWSVLRDTNGAIIWADRVPINRWEVDESDQILIDKEPVEDPLSVILIPGPHEGFLQLATRTAIGALDLERTWIAKAKNSIPVTELHENIETDRTDEERAEMVQGYIDGRDSVNGSVTMTPYDIDLKTHGEVAPALFIEGRNFVRIDVAGFFGFPASILDGSLSTASLTYSTKEGTRNEVQDYATPLWSNPIAGRLSQDDVVESGKRVRFNAVDVDTTTPSPTGPTVKD